MQYDTRVHEPRIVTTTIRKIVWHKGSIDLYEQRSGRFPSLMIYPGSSAAEMLAKAGVREPRKGDTQVLSVGLEVTWLPGAGSDRIEWRVILGIVNLRVVEMMK